jgi:hypothetical protein
MNILESIENGEIDLKVENQGIKVGLEKRDLLK